MRQDYQQFTGRDAEIIAIGPDNTELFRQYWERERMPFIGLADAKHEVLNLYGQVFNLFKLGRMPSILVIDPSGRVRYRHDGGSMTDYPSDEALLAILYTIRDEE